MEQNGANEVKFTSRECMERHIADKYTSANRHGGERKRADVYLLVRLGVCLLCFTAVLALKLSDSKDARQVLNGISTALSEDHDTDDELGRLRFVQLPSIIDVFAPSDDPVVPVEILSTEMLHDTGILILHTNIAEEVLCAGSGRIGSIGEDELLGRYVSVILENDIEVFYYGISECSVEVGQPVSQHTKLGITAAGKVVVRVYDAGRPVDPTKFFGIEQS